MIVGAIAMFGLEMGLFLVSRRFLGRYLASLPKSLTDGLPNRYALLGSLTYGLAVRRLLRIPATDPSVERLRTRAAWWQRWWPWIGMALFFPVLLAGSVIQSTLALGPFQAPSIQDARLVIYAVVVAGIVISVGRFVWRRRRSRDIQRR